MGDAGNPRVAVPAALSWISTAPGGRAWLDRLPALAAEVARDWGLRLGRPYPDGSASLAVPVRTGDGRIAVLKLQFPDRESTAEAEALAAWVGRGAVRLLAADPDRRALLIERCEPGTPLLDAGPAAVLEVLTALLPRLWVEAPAGIGTLAEEAAWWAADLERWARSGNPAIPQDLLREASAALDELPRTATERVLLNQDLHAGNVLAAEREPWLVIDPKPLAGERAFSLAPVLRDVGRRDLAAVVPALDRLSRDLGLDRERCRRWALAQTVAWGFDRGLLDPVHAAVARVLHDARA